MSLHDVARALRERPLAVVPPIVAALVAGLALWALRPSGAATTVAPDLPLVLAVTVLAGTVVGLASGVVRAALERSVRSAADLGTAVGAPALAALPVAARGRRGSVPRLHDLASASAEAYRQLRTALHSGRHPSPGVLAVTSPEPRDGRTTATCNLAAVAAAAGTSVVVVDADLRRPGVVEITGVAPAPGLTEVLAGQVEAEVAVQGCSAGFDVLASGSPPANPSELLAGAALEDLFDALHARYELVLVDTPPVLPVTDAALVAAAADGAVVLARHGRTRRVDLATAAHMLAAADVLVVGTVLVADPHPGPLLPATDGAPVPIRPRPVRPERPDQATTAAIVTPSLVTPTVVTPGAAGGGAGHAPGVDTPPAQHAPPAPRAAAVRTLTVARDGATGHRSGPSRSGSEGSGPGVSSSNGSGPDSSSGDGSSPTGSARHSRTSPSERRPSTPALHLVGTAPMSADAASDASNGTGSRARHSRPDDQAPGDPRARFPPAQAPRPRHSRV